jgi:hypothetical protein
MIAGDNDTCDKFFAGINDTGEQLSPVTMTPAKKTFFQGVVDTGQKNAKSFKFIAGVNDTANKFFTSVNDIADKTVLTIPACIDLKMKNKKKCNIQQ